MGTPVRCDPSGAGIDWRLLRIIVMGETVARFFCVAHYASKSNTIDCYILGFPANPMSQRRKIVSWEIGNRLVGVFVGGRAIEVRVIRGSR